MSAEKIGLSRLGTDRKLSAINADLDTLGRVVQLHVISIGDNDPPNSPAEGNAYVVGSAGTGAWAGHDDEVASFSSGSWVFDTPAAGWIATIVTLDDCSLWSLTESGTWVLVNRGEPGGTIVPTGPYNNATPYYAAQSVESDGSQYFLPVDYEGFSIGVAPPGGDWLLFVSKGNEGGQGIQGIQGAQGQTDFQVWLSQGNTGTYAEYRAGLVGPAGGTVDAAAQALLDQVTAAVASVTAIGDIQPQAKVFTDSASDYAPHVMSATGRLIFATRLSDGHLVVFGEIEGDGLTTAITDAITPYIDTHVYTGTGDYVPIGSMTPTGRMPLYYDRILNRAVLSDVLIEGDTGLDAGVIKPSWVEYAVGYNGLIIVSQSLGIGWQSYPALSTTQPYHNVMLAGGVRTYVASSFEPLVENNVEDGGTEIGDYEGETVCTRATSEVNRRAALYQGIDPASLVFYPSAPGKSGQSLANISPGSVVYERSMDAIRSGINIAKGQGKVCYFQSGLLMWGEYTNQNADLTREECVAALLALRESYERDIKALNNQPMPFQMLCYQPVGYSINDGDGTGIVDLAIQDCINQSPYFHFAGPIYHLNFGPDNLHLTNVGEARFAYTVGRAYHQLVVEGRVPDCIWPKSATMVRGSNTLTINFTIPKALVFAADFVPQATDQGFWVGESGSKITASGIAVGADGDTVAMALASQPTAGVVRYGLDYFGTGMTIRHGGTGNLRDTTTEQTLVDGVTYPTYHICPHFELPIIIVEPS